MRGLAQQAAQAGAGHFGQRVSCAREVVAVPADARCGRAIFGASHARFPKKARARCSSGACRAKSSSDCPSRTACQAWRMLCTPAAGPSGWARMPPPDMNIRSSVRTADHVGGTVPAHWPDENAGMTGSSMPSVSDARQSRADSTTSRSSWANLPCKPCTCIWSTPANRHSVW
ncbi:hypothetical protein G6F59_015970 [Rhizopus arrhizus]|nr:hypothetical protein G6F59_015970 [Rhizopus arrhizus]